MAEFWIYSLWSKKIQSTDASSYRMLSVQESASPFALNLGL